MGVNWSGYTWNVRNQGTSGPGNNKWSSKNVSIDSEGNLHLKIQPLAEGWTCAEVYTTQRFHYGMYEWWVDCQLDRLDKNVILGMFLYPPGGSGVPDGTNEVDIEVSKWGNENGKNLLYNCFSTTNGITRGSNYDMKLNGSYTTHRFQWTPDHVSYESMHGHQNDSTFQFVNWTTPSDIAHLIPSMELTVHINLWLFEGRPPSDGKPVEVVIKRFRHH